MGKEDFVKALNDFLKDIRRFYYGEIYPLSSFCRNNGVLSEIMTGYDKAFTHENLAHLVISLENDSRELNDILYGLMNKPNSVAGRRTLEDYALCLTMPVKIDRGVEATFDGADEILYLARKAEFDCITSYIDFVKNGILAKYPKGLSYQSALIHSIIQSPTSFQEYRAIAQRLRSIDIGKLFQKYAKLLSKHLSKGTILGDFIGYCPETNEREIPTLREAFARIDGRISLRKGKGYSNIVRMLRKAEDWDSQDMADKLSAASREYMAMNSLLANSNILEPYYNGRVFFRPYSTREMRMSGIRGYSQQKGELRKMLGRFSDGLATPHIALIGPPGTGKTSLFLAAITSYKKIKFLFVDRLLQDPHVLSDLPRILEDLGRYSRYNFLLCADDTTYDKERFELLWDNVRSLIEGTRDFSPNTRLLMSTNNWDKFPLSFRSRFGAVIKLNYPNSWTKISIARYHRTKYNVGEDVSKILEEAQKTAETGNEQVSGRTIEQICQRWGLYKVETGKSLQNDLVENPSF